MAYQMKKIQLTYSEQPHKDFNFELKEWNDKNLEEYFFLPSDNHIIITWDSENHKKTHIDNIDTLLQAHKLHEIRKNIFKYLLYQYKNNDQFIWEKLKEVFLNDYYFIEKVEQLINLNKNNLQGGQEVINVCKELILETFIDNTFDISNNKREQISQENSKIKNEEQLLIKFIYFIIGPYQNQQLIPETHFENNKLKWEQICKSIVKQFTQNKQSFPTPLVREIYFLSLDNELAFIKYFKEVQKNKTQWDNIKKQYKENYPTVNENEIEPIIDDLFAKQLFTNTQDIKKPLFMRYPLWLIIKLNYIQSSKKKECFNYFDLMLKQMSKQSTNKSAKDYSVLQSNVLFLKKHIETDLLKYFSIENKNSIKFVLNRNTNIFDKFNSEHKQKVLELKELICLLITDRIENSLTITLNKHKEDLNNSEQFIKILENKIEEEYKNIETSLENKYIFKYANKKLLPTLNKDFINKKTISIDPIDLTLPQFIKNALENKKNFPEFLTEIPFDKSLILEVLKLKEPSLKNDPYMHNILSKIIHHILTRSPKSNTVLFKTLYTFVINNIIELKILHNIHSLVIKVSGKTELTEESNDNAFNDETDSLILINEFNSLIKNNITLTNLKNKYEELNQLITYSNEFFRRTNQINEHLLLLKLYQIIIKYVDENEVNLLLDGQECSSLNLINEYNESIDSIIHGSITILRKLTKKEDEHLFVVEIMKICFDKCKISNNKEESLKVLLSYIFMNPELSLKGISLYQEIMGYLISLDVNKDYSKINMKNIFSNIKNETTTILETVVKYAKMKETKQEKINKIILNVQYMLIQSIEKYFLNFLSTNSKSLINNNKFIEDCVITCLAHIRTFNNNLIQQNLQTIGTIELFKQFISIAFLKVYLNACCNSLLSETNTNDFYWINNYISENLDDEAIRIIQFYMLKFIREQKCDTFEQFKFFDFFRYQFSWVSSLKFSGTYNSLFEYIFFSDWEDQNSIESTFSYFERYHKFTTNVFIPLKQQIFRISTYDERIQDSIKQGNVEIIIDTIMNIILCNTYSHAYNSKLEYVEFCFWYKRLINELNIDNKQLYNFLSFFIYNNSNDKQFNCYSNVLKSLEKENNKDILVKDLEIILISLKFVLAFILNGTTFPLEGDNIHVNTENQYETLLINYLSDFIIRSIHSYQNSFECESLLKNFKEIKHLLRINNINQIKLFMNFLYVRIKNSDNTVTKEQLINIIENAIKDWPKQITFINKFYEFMLYKEEKIRNLLLEERITNESMDGSICHLEKVNDKPLIIPVYKLFYLEIFPSWEHFTKTYSSQINSGNYPYTQFFSKPGNHSLYGKKLNSNEIKQINQIQHEKKNFYHFNYSGFSTLDELANYYSESYVFAAKIPNSNLGYYLKYDIDKIERELSLIKYFIAENLS